MCHCVCVYTCVCICVCMCVKHMKVSCESVQCMTILPLSDHVDLCGISTLTDTKKNKHFLLLSCPLLLSTIS